MKTTLDIPNDLYRQAKAMAALERIRVKDLVAEGLRLAMEEHKHPKKRATPLAVLRKARRNPLHTSDEVTRMMEQSRHLRKDGWSRADLP
jgi:hypothetical protein